MLISFNKKNALQNWQFCSYFTKMYEKLFSNTSSNVLKLATAENVPKFSWKKGNKYGKTYGSMCQPLVTRSKKVQEIPESQNWKTYMNLSGQFYILTLLHSKIFLTCRWHWYFVRLQKAILVFFLFHIWEDFRDRCTSEHQIYLINIPIYYLKVGHFWEKLFRCLEKLFSKILRFWIFWNYDTLNPFPLIQCWLQVSLSVPGQHCLR